MILNERETDEGTLVSVCDPDIIGETFDDGEISLTVDEGFYDGEEVDEQTVLDSLSQCTVANLVGTETVTLAVEHGFIDEENVLDIDGTRHAQLLWM
ncbi:MULTISPECIES: DUF424 domain-containing protein [Halomicrobium]|uniref:DUF424 domain-containing protein n=2 Tax=Halomicrobium mukohataei TaxID=57705 RepID=C7P2P1_HALMD|nr:MULTISPECIES: DUF424 domain-containing protein [Halomicrobium]ACV47363.1 Protein of unknown function DUF424 [Halomicrobium mukohataei DSM 12286]NLV09559.1 DUF424 family protein [Halomicrobium mukohataei]QCD65830.1 DUF424 domain-containing protein [Halomicrobium mukohataei]QFR20635.1 DUF424 family protein [Halomicrobium sp. ZPS1]